MQDTSRLINTGEEHEEDRSRYTIGFFLLVLILASSILAVTIKALLVWLGQ